MQLKKLSVILAVVMLFATGCTQEEELKQVTPAAKTETTLAGNVAKPAWAVPEDYDMTSSMTAIVKVDLTQTYEKELAGLNWKVSADDVFAAFDGETCIGVAELSENLFFLYITAPASGAQTVALRYWSSALKNVFVAQETITFANDQHLGSVSEPFAPKFVVKQ